MPDTCTGAFTDAFSPVAKRLKTKEPTRPAKIPDAAPMASARTTLPAGLKAKGASRPGMGEAVPGALFTMPSRAAAIPASPPPRKSEA